MRRSVRLFVPTISAPGEPDPPAMDCAYCGHALLWQEIRGDDDSPALCGPCEEDRPDAIKPGKPRCLMCD